MSFSLTATAGRHAFTAKASLDRPGSSAFVLARRGIALSLAIVPWLVVILRPGLHLAASGGVFIVAGAPLVAVAILAISGITLSRTHGGDATKLDLQVKLPAIEWLIILIAVAFIVPFAGHLVADQYPCMNGRASAC